MLPLFHSLGLVSIIVIRLCHAGRVVYPPRDAPHRWTLTPIVFDASLRPHALAQCGRAHIIFILALGRVVLGHCVSVSASHVRVSVFYNFKISVWSVVPTVRLLITRGRKLSMSRFFYISYHRHVLSLHRLIFIASPLSGPCACHLLNFYFHVSHLQLLHQFLVLRLASQIYFNAADCLTILVCCKQLSRI